MIKHGAVGRVGTRLLALIMMTAAGTMTFASAVEAQDYPNRAVRLVVPFAPGGGSDIVARLIGDPISNALGKPIIIDNKPGSGAVIGADFVAKSPADGYTLLYTTAGPQITNPYLLPSLPYDPNKDLVPVALLAKNLNVLVVSPNVPAKTVKELIDYAKANPGKVSFSSSGLGSSSHLSGEMFKQLAGVDIIHVPYRGTGPAIQDLLAGRIEMTIDTVATLLPHIQSGGLRRTRRRNRAAEPRAARRADHCRDVAGVRGQLDQLHQRSRRNPAADHRAAQSRVQCGDEPR